MKYYWQKHGEEKDKLEKIVLLIIVPIIWHLSGLAFRLRTACNNKHKKIWLERKLCSFIRKIS